jgi:hypothetical protein
LIASTQNGLGAPARTNLPASGLFQFSDGTLSSILPWRVKFGLLGATISILAFLFESAQGLFLGAIHYHFREHTIVLEQQQ